MNRSFSSISKVDFSSLDFSAQSTKSISYRKIFRFCDEIDFCRLISHFDRQGSFPVDRSSGSIDKLDFSSIESESNRSSTQARALRPRFWGSAECHGPAPFKTAGVKPAPTAPVPQSFFPASFFRQKMTCRQKKFSRRNVLAFLG